MERKRLYFAGIMAGITGSATSTMGALFTHGAQGHFVNEFMHRFVIAYPTIVFCILFIAPHVQAMLNRKLAQD